MRAPRAWFYESTQGLARSPTAPDKPAKTGSET